MSSEEYRRAAPVAAHDLLEGLGVADAVRDMCDEDVRGLVVDAYASGFVQTLHDATRVVSKAAKL